MFDVVPSPVPLVLARDHFQGQPPHRDPFLVRIHPGVYAPRSVWAKLHPWERYLARVHAVRLTWTEPTFLLESAAVLQGLPLFGEPLHVHVLGGTNGLTAAHSTSKGAVRIHHLRDPRPTVTADGCSIIDVAHTVIDLARALPPAFAVAVADAGLRRLEATADELAARAHAQSVRRGRRRLDDVLGWVDPLAESAGESVSRVVIAWLGFPAPESQVWFHSEGFRDRSDFFWRKARIIGESDGYGKYDATNVAAAKAHFIEEKKREDRLRRQVDGFARWEMSDALSPRRLDLKLRSAGLLAERRPNETMLMTLRSNPRSHPPQKKPAAAEPYRLR
jgi:hypothetical protein